MFYQSLMRYAWQIPSTAACTYGKPVDISQSFFNKTLASNRCASLFLVSGAAEPSTADPAATGPDAPSHRRPTSAPADLRPEDADEAAGAGRGGPGAVIINWAYKLLSGT